MEDYVVDGGEGKFGEGEGVVVGYDWVLERRGVAGLCGRDGGLGIGNALLLAYLEKRKGRGCWRNVEGVINDMK